MDQNQILWYVFMIFVLQGIQMILYFHKGCGFLKSNIREKSRS